MNAKTKTVSVLALAVGLAGLLTVSGTRLAASQGTTLTAMATTDTVPVKDPWSSWWDRVPKVDVPLSAQQITPPMGGHRWTMQARAVQDGTNLYIMLQWPDATANRSVGAPQLFTDAAAVQFPGVAAEKVPAFCMGDPTATVNIWQWKAAWQADVANGFQGDVKTQYPNTEVDLYPFHNDPTYYPGRYVGNPFSVTKRTSPVDNLVAAGFGTLTADPTPLVNGWGVWANGNWRVVFERPLSVSRDGNVDLATNDWSDVAFAVWDGAAMERNGMKSVGNFVTLHVTPQSVKSASHFPFWPAPFFVFAAIWGLFTLVVAGREAKRARA